MIRSSSMKTCQNGHVIHTMRARDMISAAWSFTETTQRHSIYERITLKCAAKWSNFRITLYIYIYIYIYIHTHTHTYIHTHTYHRPGSCTLDVNASFYKILTADGWNELHVEAQKGFETNKHRQHNITQKFVADVLVNLLLSYMRKHVRKCVYIYIYNIYIYIFYSAAMPAGTGLLACYYIHKIIHKPCTK